MRTCQDSVDASRQEFVRVAEELSELATQRRWQAVGGRRRGQGQSGACHQCRTRRPLDRGPGPRGCCGGGRRADASGTSCGAHRHRSASESRRDENGDYWTKLQYDARFLPWRPANTPPDGRTDPGLAKFASFSPSRLGMGRKSEKISLLEFPPIMNHEQRAQAIVVAADSASAGAPISRS